MQYYDDFYDGLKETRNILYRQIDTVATLNKLLSTLYSEKNNLKNYKNNVTGDNVLNIKDYITNMIYTFDEYEEKLEQLIKIKEGYPIYQLNDIENISLIKTIPSMDYKITTVQTNLNKELNIIKKLVNEAITSAYKENDYYTVTLLSELLFNINNDLLNFSK